MFSFVMECFLQNKFPLHKILENFQSNWLLKALHKLDCRVIFFLIIPLAISSDNVNELHRYGQIYGLFNYYAF